MATNQGLCPKCNQPNDYTAVVCGDCGARLPWADAVTKKSGASTAPLIPIDDTPTPLSQQPLQPHHFQPHTTTSTTSKIKHPLASAATTILAIFIAFVIAYFGYNILTFGTPIGPEMSWMRGVDKNKLEAQIKDSYNQELDNKNAGFTCVAVRLVKESSNKYTGYAALSTGEKFDVTVTIGEDNELIWKVSP